MDAGMPCVICYYLVVAQIKLCRVTIIQLRGANRGTLSWGQHKNYPKHVEYEFLQGKSSLLLYVWGLSSALGLRTPIVPGLL